MLTLIIGDKNLSSWSLRPWLVLKHFEFEFKEIMMRLDTPQFRAQIERYTPTRRAPVLIDDALHIWDSLAIAEYLNEKTGGRAWPSEPAARAHARSISAEMHSGFSALRTSWPMRALGRNASVVVAPEVAADIARIDAMWSECRSIHGGEGPWLFGAYSIADAMYAPVVLRFNYYGATLSDSAASYARHTLKDEHLKQWLAGAEAEVAGQ